MPWKVPALSEVRLAFVPQVLRDQQPVAAACRAFGIRRKTGYQWLRR